MLLNCCKAHILTLYAQCQHGGVKQQQQQRHMVRSLRTLCAKGLRRPFALPGARIGFCVMAP